jgi:hypothetical protein
VDINLFVHNGAETIAAAIESVLAQTWTAWTLTVIDNASTDATLAVVRSYAAAVPGLRVYRARANGGSVVNCQRAFSQGDADFVMPKTADDLLAPQFLEQTMAVLLDHPDCVMCHAGGLVFAGAGDVLQVYPETHRLHAVGDDPAQRARHVMARYTSAPSFWGVYRRHAVDRLGRFRYRAGWDHVVLAELALYGEIRHVPEVLYWRRDGGKPVLSIARASTEAAQRNLPLDDDLAELRWTTPLITTAYAHVETFAVARLAQSQRVGLMRDAVAIFCERWLGRLHQEAAAFRSALPSQVKRAAEASAFVSGWMKRQIADAAHAVDTVLPEQGMCAFHERLVRAADAPVTPPLRASCSDAADCRAD